MDLSCLNYAFIILILKKDAAFTPSDFWPINLSHSCIKMITKVLVLQLKPFMNVIINEVHTAYIKDCSILDNILCASEIIYQ